MEGKEKGKKKKGRRGNKFLVTALDFVLPKCHRAESEQR